MNPLTWAFHDQLTLLIGVFWLAGMVGSFPTWREWGDR